MAGDGLLHDAGIDRWARMRETTTQHFRWTPRRALQALVWGVAVPLALYEATVFQMVRGLLGLRAGGVIGGSLCRGGGRGGCRRRRTGSWSGPTASTRASLIN